MAELENGFIVGVLILLSIVCVACILLGSPLDMLNAEISMLHPTDLALPPTRQGFGTFFVRESACYCLETSQGLAI